MREYYLSLLGLPSSASDSDIKETYRNLVKKTHPDVNPSPNATSDFQKITEAYEWLMNPVAINDSQEFVYEESEYERKKREYLQRRQEKERLKREAELKNKIATYSYLRYTAYATLLFGMIMVIDNFLPEAIFDEHLQFKYQQSTGISRKYSPRGFENHWVTNISDFRVPLEAYFNLEEGDKVVLSKTPILHRIKEAHYFSQEIEYSFNVPNLYSYWMALPLLILFSSIFPIKNKEYSEGWLYATYSAIGFSGLAILIMIL